MDSVRCVVRVIARPGKAADLRSVLFSLLAPTRKEKGCLRYELLQNKSDPADFTFVEEWASDAAIDAHFGTPHVAAVLSKVESLLAAPPDIRRYSVVG